MQREYFEPREDGDDGDDDRERFIDDTRVDFERNAQESGDGARDRDTARTINGALGQVPCRTGLRCQSDICMRPDTLCKGTSIVV